MKSAASAGKTQVQAEEATAQLPNPLAVESPGDHNVSGLVSSEANVSKPTLARIKISQSYSQGLLIKSVQPKYPRNAPASHIEETVQVEATITKEGKVVNPKVLKGDRLLTAAALEAVRQWRYKPYYLDGQPVEIQTEITINFKGN